MAKRDAEGSEREAGSNDLVGYPLVLSPSEQRELLDGVRRILECLEALRMGMGLLDDEVGRARRVQ